MPVRLAIPAVIALHGWFDEARTVGGLKGITVVARIAGHRLRSDLRGMLGIPQMPRHRFAYESAQCLLVHHSPSL